MAKINIVKTDIEIDNFKAKKIIQSVESKKNYIEDTFTVDIGFGYTKFKSEEYEGAIASIVTPVDQLTELQLKNQSLGNINTLAIIHNEQIQLVGDLAAQFNRQVSRSTFKDRSIDDNFEILYKAAIVAAYHDYTDVKLKVGTGLPNRDINDQKDTLIALIKNITEVEYFKDNGQKHTISITYDLIDVCTQPEGCYYEFMYNDNLELETQVINDEEINKFGIIDLGHGTIDLSIFENGNIIGLGERTCSLDGINTLYKRVGIALQEKFNSYEPSHLNIENAILYNLVQVRGKKYNVDDLISDTKENFSNLIFKSIYEKWKNEFDSLNAILIIGGGANIVLVQLATLIVQKLKYNNVFSLGEKESDYQLLNVRGFRKRILLLNK